MRNFLTGVVVALLLAATPTMAAPQQQDSKWTWFEKTEGTSGVDSIKVLTACLGAEDSAAHLKLLRYNGGTVVYGCYHGGY